MDNGASSYRRFLDGDDEEIVKIVGEYKDGLILYLNGYVKNIRVAEEVTEDAFFRLIANKPRFSGKSSFKSWLYAIGRHIAVDYIRRNTKLINTPLEALENYSSDELNLELSYIKEEDKITLHKAINELIPEYRTYFGLCTLKDFRTKRLRPSSERITVKSPISYTELKSH